LAEYQVVFFQKENGEAPVKDFISTLDYKMKAKVYRLLTMVSENGPELREAVLKTSKRWNIRASGAIWL